MKEAPPFKNVDAANFLENQYKWEAEKLCGSLRHLDHSLLVVRGEVSYQVDYVSPQGNKYISLHSWNRGNWEKETEVIR